MVGSWDEGVDYEIIKNKIIKEIKMLKNKEGYYYVKKLAKLIVYAIQLRNGSRISEALDAFIKFMNKDYNEKNDRKITVVKVRKKKSIDYRYMIYPEWLPFSLIAKIKKYNVELTIKQLKDSCRALTGVNTHSLRYAFITHLAKRGVNPSLIAKMTHHTNLNYVLRYTQQKEADELLINLDL